MMKPKILLSALILLLSAGISYAQQSLTCRGTVRDRSGQPMPGVAVLIKGTQAGSMTDINGYYVVDVPSAGTELEFLCMGYKTQVQKVPKSFNLDVFLDEDTLEMEEAVVVGMGYQRKAS
ncbi:MAG: carboxypeptidase-like regulatory domain-containing protein, partial [Bacteroidales bacterium]|nr:carboxypeptidase-like regulatory domain-containing protein [Bacteroidales bacterium]